MEKNTNNKVRDVYTITYITEKGLYVPVFEDDYGQCFYFYDEGIAISCGAYCGYEAAIEDYYEAKEIARKGSRR